MKVNQITKINSAFKVTKTFCESANVLSNPTKDTPAVTDSNKNMCEAAKTIAADVQKVNIKMDLPTITAIANHAQEVSEKAYKISLAAKESRAESNFTPSLAETSTK